MCPQSSQAGATGFIDLHCHVLPAIDDGPRDLEQSLAILKFAFDSGTRIVTSTSHLYSPHFAERTPQDFRDRFEKLLVDLEDRARENPWLAELGLVLGAEHYVDVALFDALDFDQVVPLANSRNLLIEFPTMLPAWAFHGAVEKIQDAGWRPVIAHIERYPALMSNLALIKELVSQDCLVQVNAEAIQKRGWGRRKRPLDELFDRQLVHAVASDGHGTRRRPPSLAAAFQALARRYSDAEARRWVIDYPKSILQSVPKHTNS